MKLIIANLIVLMSFQVSGQTKVKECNLGPIVSDIVFLEKFTTPIFSSDAKTYLENYNSMITMPVTDEYSCTELKNAGKNILKGIIEAFNGLALAHTYDKNTLAFVTDMYCMSIESSECEISMEDIVPPQYIYSNSTDIKRLKNILE
ncbi:MAG: hypothetical protein AB8E15_01415 [Bdellovibrionales bacterium]